MNGWMLALVASAPVLVTKTFSANETFVVPYGVSNLVTVSGKGADGTPSSYSGDVARSGTIDNILAFSGQTGGANSGHYSWSTLSGDATSAASTINNGGSGSVVGVNYTGRLGDDTYDLTLGSYVYYTNAIPGSATARFPGTYGSGPITSDASSYNYVTWSEYGTTTPAKTGASSTGFGKTFAGGSGGVATTTTYNNVAVTEAQAYSIVVPSGGSITITYYQ